MSDFRCLRDRSGCFSVSQSHDGRQSGGYIDEGQEEDNGAGGSSQTFAAGFEVEFTLSLIASQYHSRYWLL